MTTTRPASGVRGALHAWASSPLHPTTLLAPAGATAGWVATGRSVPAGLAALAAVVTTSALTAVRRRPTRVEQIERATVAEGRR